MKNKYIKLLEQENLGSLRRMINIKKLEIKQTTETERLRIFVRFIIENLKEEKIKVVDLIKQLCLLEKALANRINGKFLINEHTGKRFQARGSFDHYRVILLHALREMKIEYDDKLILDKNQLIGLSEIIWH